MTAAIVSIDVSEENFSNAAEVHSWRIPGLAIKAKRADKHFGLGVTLLLLAGNVKGCAEHGMEAINRALIRPTCLKDISHRSRYIQ
jgi:hypothetical protein